MSSIDAGCTEVRPRSVLTSTGKKQSAAAITIFDHGLRVPNQAFVIGANAITGIAFAAIRYGISALPSGRQRASTSAARMAMPLPSRSPPNASLKVIQAAVFSASRFSQRALRTSESRGRRNGFTPRTSGKIHCQQSSPIPKTSAAGSHVRANPGARASPPSDLAAATVLTQAPPRRTPSRRRGAVSRTSVTSSKNRGSSRVRTPRGCGRSMSTTPAIRPGRGDITTTRVERKTASEIECVTKMTVDLVSAQMESSSRLSRSRVISSSAPNGSSISSSAGENESARAIETRCCMPPESCQG